MFSPLSVMSRISVKCLYRILFSRHPIAFIIFLKSLFSLKKIIVNSFTAHAIICFHLMNFEVRESARQDKK